MSQTKSPKLHLENYFRDLKNQVDLFYCNKEEKNQDWLDTIKEIESFEKDCLRNCIPENLSQKELDEEIFEIKKHLFGNKTIQFVPKFKRKKLEKEDSFLLIINDAYLSQNISEINISTEFDKITKGTIDSIIIFKH